MRIYVHIPLVLSCFLQPHSAAAQAVLEEFAGGFVRPVAVTHAGDSRLFVAEQAGRIRVVDTGGVVREEPFLDISSRVLSTGNEQGLLGLAFHPDYGVNGYFFVNYTDAGGHTVIARFSAATGNPDQADTGNMVTVLTVEQPYSNHNGGDIKFGPDGYLYIGLGDGGSAGDPQDRAQDPGQLLGKMLRIDVDGGEPYTIPVDNPFMKDPSVLGEIWAPGLRNPWRFSFDRETGDLWIADVGQAIREEINFQPAGSPGGENYGWRCYEGSLEYNTEDCRDRGEYTFPVHEYAHDPGGHCSVTGGFVYRGMDYPVLRGHYFFADHCSGALWSLRDTAGEWVAGDHGKYTGNGFSTFGEDSRGELYVAGLESGILFRVASSGGTSSEGTLPAPGSRVWPNPAGERLRVEPGMQGKGGVRATLFDLEGKKVFGSGPYNGSFSLDLGGLPAGVYILSLQAGTERETHRITKE